MSLNYSFFAFFCVTLWRDRSYFFFRLRNVECLFFPYFAQNFCMTCWSPKLFSRFLLERLTSVSNRCFVFVLTVYPFFFSLLFLGMSNYFSVVWFVSPGGLNFRVVWPNVMRILSTPTDGYLSNVTLLPVTQLLYPSLGGRRENGESRVDSCRGVIVSHCPTDNTIFTLNKSY